MEKKSYFQILNAIDVSEHIEKKSNGRVELSYLSWAWAWAEVKKAFPDATYTIYENADGWFYHTDGKTCWVKTGVTINNIEHIEYLPVMNNRNASIPANEVTSFDVNKAIQRSLTKAAARHGIGLYIYAGEDLPEDVKKQQEAQRVAQEREKLDKALQSVADCVSRAELTAIWKSNNDLHTDPEFVAAVTEKGKTYNKESK